MLRRYLHGLLFLLYCPCQSCLIGEQIKEQTFPADFSKVITPSFVWQWTGDFLAYRVWDGFAFVALVLDEEPTYRDGGNEVFMAGIYSGLHYPMEARESQVEGIVLLTLVIDEFGEMEALGVERGLGAGCELAALTAARNVAIKGFRPGLMDGKARKVKLEIPIIFSLQ